MKFFNFTHLDKIYFPKDGYSKEDLLNYYNEVSSFILPYLKNRPNVLHRFPNGIESTGFYQKDVHFPDWVPTAAVHHLEKDVNYLMIPNKKTLLFAANLGCVDFHPFNSRIQSLDYPDYLVIDLDPEEISFKEVVYVAQAFYDLLQSHCIPSYCKTSGATGLHIYIPLGAKYDYATTKNFARILAELVHQELPATTSLERSPSKRKRKVYLDYLQNNFGQTLAAPYSVRPRPKAPVSTPLEWKEVKESLEPTDFTIKTIIPRIKKKGDLFKPILGKGVSLDKTLRTIC